MVFIGVAFGFFGNMLNVDPHVSANSIVAVTFVAAAGLTVIAIWLKPVWLGAFNGAIMVGLVITAATMVFPRFDVTDTMRPWQTALAQLIPSEEVVLLYKPERWAEYGMQYYRPNHIRTVFSLEELADATKAGVRLLCISDDKALPEVSRKSSVDLQIVHTIGNHTAFWVWQEKKF